MCVCTVQEQIASNTDSDSEMHCEAARVFLPFTDGKAEAFSGPSPAQPKPVQAELFLIGLHLRKTCFLYGSAQSRRSSTTTRRTSLAKVEGVARGPPPRPTRLGGWAGGAASGSLLVGRSHPQLQRPQPHKGDIG